MSSQFSYRDVLNIYTVILHTNLIISVTQVQKYTSTQVPSHICLLFSRDSSTKVLNIHTRYLHGNFSTSVTEVQKYIHKVLTWELQYFCSRSTEVHTQGSYMGTCVLL